MPRIVSYNLMHGRMLAQHGRVDLDAAASAIAALDADMVALQEVDRGLARTGARDQVRSLADALGWQGLFAPALLGDPDREWVASEGEDPGGPGYGVGLLSRHPIRSWRRTRLPGGGDGARRPRPAAAPADDGAPSPGPARKPLGFSPGWDHEPRTVLCAVIDAPVGALRVAVTHLSYLPWRGLAQLRAAARWAGPGAGPVVLAGDLNLPGVAVRAALPGWLHAGGGPTHPAWEPRFQLDHILCRGLRVAEVSVAAASTSDHRPLLASLEPTGATLARRVRRRK